TAATFSPDGSKVATASRDKTARVWDAAERTELLRLKHPESPVGAVAFSPDGSKVFTACHGLAWTCSVTTGQQLAVSERPAFLGSETVFSRDGSKALTSVFEVAYTWDVATGKTLAKLKGNIRSFSAAAFSPDGSRVATCGDDKKVRVWDAE